MRKSIVVLFAAWFLGWNTLEQKTLLHAQQNSTAVEQQLQRVNADVQKGPFSADWNSLGGYRVPDWFRDAKFGIFVHWGVFSVPAYANEWYPRNMYLEGNDANKHQVATYGSLNKFGYKDFIPMFKAEKFDAKAWVDLFARSGARYVVPVAEHCDGFSMYDSSINPWNAVKMGPHRDIVGEVAAATRARGLHFGASSHRAEHWWWYEGGRKIDSDVNDPRYAELYGPAMPQHLPGDTSKKEPDPRHLEKWLAPDKAFTDDWLARTAEIIDKYQPEFLYLDWWIGQPAFQPDLQRLAAYYYNHAAASGHPVVLTYKEYDFPENAAVLDVERGKLDALRLLPWQTDTSISVHSWGYIENDEYRDAKSLIDELADVVSKNGNLLLNVGPRADGTIPEKAQKILLEMGHWLDVNGEAIYGSRPFALYGEGPTKVSSQSLYSDKQEYTPADIRYTTNKGMLYAIALGWPSDGTLKLKSLYKGNPYLSTTVCRVDLLGQTTQMEWSQEEDGLTIKLPHAATDEPAFTFRIHTTKDGVCK
ncbi:alpha-L-fucosidase [Telmatobacter bradus]|uniref:alpha-L-fucosidase n=1 Tax=Telmatobacter bradus TaxID=474953 RepID=UPI003B43ADA1